MTERPPLRQSLLALLISVSVTGLAWLGAVYAAPESFRREIAWGAGAAALLLTTAVVTATRALGTGAVLRDRIAELEAETARFADETVPALTERLREGLSADSALAAVEQPGSEALRRVLRTHAAEVRRGEAAKSAALAASANAAGRMQALATSMLADLREMEHRHGDETVLGDLLHLDHRTAQAGRLADSIAVLTGARSGRRWAKPIVMESILRGAMGRIAGYQRVRLHSAVDVAIAGHAAEGVMHALAELLDNAANFSPPTAEVHVYAEEVPAGVILTVEDSGLVMSEVALRRAERAVSGESLDLSALSGTRLGLAVVGCLARKYGLKVSFRPSARGGTGALLMIPQDLVSRPRPTAVPAPEPAARVPAQGRGKAPEPAGEPTPESETPTGTGPEPENESENEREAEHKEERENETAEAPPATADHSPAADDDLVEYSDSGLPKRRRGRTLAGAHPQGTPKPPRPASSAAHSPAESAARFGAFRSAVRGRGDTPPQAPATPTSHPEDDTP
ncbi:sensor histidine kinase [Streptomyces litchfieldiae]|uniref:histidine kinase n=1 Tax=Streptomyces litchfieldiae TaxID=3075543 RepID=A0ABU2MNK7_9ACTN|nr:ATP-binding protein [Streptomyces sp. DSM 44938]MDT0343205.1 ATP-binding protein [Streptomyces sp. DSM 44938]